MKGYRIWLSKARSAQLWNRRGLQSEIFEIQLTSFEREKSRKIPYSCAPMRASIEPRAVVRRGGFEPAILTLAGFCIRWLVPGSIAVARYPRHTAQALHFARSPGRGLWRNVK